MSNCWDLTRELVSVMADIDRKIEEKSKSSSISYREVLDREIDALESRMFTIKNILKRSEIGIVQV